MFKLIEARTLKVGDWIRRGRLSPMRVVSVEHDHNGRILVRHDFGDGGEPATSFYWPDETVALS